MYNTHRRKVPGNIIDNFSLNSIYVHNIEGTFLAYNDQKPIFLNKTTSVSSKLRIFGALLESIFMHNSLSYGDSRKPKKKTTPKKKSLNIDIPKVKNSGHRTKNYTKLQDKHHGHR